MCELEKQTLTMWRLITMMSHANFSHGSLSNCFSSTVSQLNKGTAGDLCIDTSVPVLIRAPDLHCLVICDKMLWPCHTSIFTQLPCCDHTLCSARVDSTFHHNVARSTTTRRNIRLQREESSVVSGTSPYPVLCVLGQRTSTQRTIVTSYSIH